MTRLARNDVRLERPIEEIASAAAAKLRSLHSGPGLDLLDLEARLQLLVALGRDTRELSLYHTQHVLSPESASDRILEYLLMHVGEPVPREVLDTVAAISEYPRRIREWRIEFGWPIKYHHGRDAYLLERSQPDGVKAELWQKMNDIRRSGGTIMDRMLRLFLTYPNRKITTAQLRYVAGNEKDMRRVRQIRTEWGYRIMTKKTGRPDLRGGTKAEYILVDTEPVAEHDRVYKENTLVKVLTRDGSRCRKSGCAWHPSDAVPGDPRQYIEVHHVTWHAEGGKNVEQNLATLCNVHHKEVHREKLKEGDFWSWLNTPA